MSMCDAPVAALSWLGRQGTRAVAALVAIGIALPSIGAILKPYVTEAVFVLLCIAFLRLDAAAFKTCLRRPAIVLAATAWTSVAIPVLFGASCLAFGLNKQAPDLFLGLMLQAVASPMMAAPALAALMGLDATLVLVALIASTALVPLTAPLLALVFVGRSLSIPPLILAIKLFVILAGAALVGLDRASGSWPRGHCTAQGENRRPQYPRPFRLRGSRYGKCRCSFPCHPTAHNGSRGACLCGVLGCSFAHYAPVSVRRPSARPCARIHGVTAEYGADARGDRWGLARSHLAVFRSFPVPYLSVAAAPSAAGATDSRAGAARRRTGVRAEDAVSTLDV